MTKGELIDHISNTTTGDGVGKKEIGAIVTAVFALAGQTVRESGRFSFPGFGTFTVTERAARTGRNPRTGETIEIKASKSIKFKPAPSLKNSL